MTGWAEPPGHSGSDAALNRVLHLPPLEAAESLLGALVSHAGVTVRLTEVEAYAGPDDPGSHAFRRTPRSEIMYGAAGRLYVYSIYGLHLCANVVVGEDGRPGAVLLRGGEVVAGREDARARRAGALDAALARGPGNLARSLGLTAGHNGADLRFSPVRLRLGGTAHAEVRRGPRVGLRRAAEVPWRLWLAGEPTVSTYRPAATRHRAPRPPRPGPPLAP